MFAAQAVCLPLSKDDCARKLLDRHRQVLHNARLQNAPVAQLDRVPGYEPGGRRFESFRARQIAKPLQCSGFLLPKLKSSQEFPTR